MSPIYPKTEPTLLELKKRLDKLLSAHEGVLFARKGDTPELRRFLYQRAEFYKLLTRALNLSISTEGVKSADHET